MAAMNSPPSAGAANNVSTSGQVIAVGLDDHLYDEVRLALGHHHQVTAAYPTVAAAVEAFRQSPAEPRVLLTAFHSRGDENDLHKLNAALAGWPVVALVDLHSETENLFWANRAGAAQLVPLPLDPKDLRAALDTAGVQFNLGAALGTTIAFTAASGGCGASTLALAAAQDIAARHGRKTLLIELTPQMGVLAMNLNVNPVAELPELVERADHLDLDLLQNSLTPAGDNLFVIPGPAGVMPAGWMDRRGMAKVIELARRLADVVILDVPPTFDALQFEVVNEADHAVLICQQSIAAVRALRLLMDNLGGVRTGGTHLVLNQFDPAAKGLSVEDIERATGKPGLRPVPRDTAGMLDAVNRGQALRDVAPNSPILKAVAGLTAQMLGSPAGGAKPTVEPGMFSRFFNALRG